LVDGDSTSSNFNAAPLSRQAAHFLGLLIQLGQVVGHALDPADVDIRRAVELALLAEEAFDAPVAGAVAAPAILAPAGAILAEAVEAVEVAAQERGVALVGEASGDPEVLLEELDQFHHFGIEQIETLVRPGAGPGGWLFRFSIG
jgi:hypothetical protein